MRQAQGAGEKWPRMRARYKEMGSREGIFSNLDCKRVTAEPVPWRYRVICSGAGSTGAEPAWGKLLIGTPGSRGSPVHSQCQGS